MFFAAYAHHKKISIPHQNIIVLLLLLDLWFLFDSPVQLQSSIKPRCSGFTHIALHSFRWIGLKQLPSAVCQVCRSWQIGLDHRCASFPISWFHSSFPCVLTQIHMEYNGHTTLFLKINSLELPGVWPEFFCGRRAIIKGRPRSHDYNQRAEPSAKSGSHYFGGRGLYVGGGAIGRGLVDV